MGMEREKSPTVECHNCGASIIIDGLEDFIQCPYCRTNYSVSELLGESDSVSAERIKAKAFLKAEAERQKIEAEWIKQEAERAEKQAVKENAAAFKKGIFSKVLIAFIIISLFRCVVSFSDHYILAGIIEAAAVALFVIAYLMGAQVIKEKRHNLRLLPAILAFILLVSSASASGYSPDAFRAEKFLWPDIVLCEILPETSSLVGVIHANTENELWIEVHNISQSDYTNYIKACKNAGYTVERDESSIAYEAYNEAGYNLYLFFNSGDEELSICLEAPMEMTAITWPNSAVAKMLPAPKSTTGRIVWEDESGFSIYIGNTPIEDFNEYATACSEKGFDQGYSRGDDYYYADNKKGYHLSLNYQGNQIMSVRIAAP